MSEKQLSHKNTKRFHLCQFALPSSRISPLRNPLLTISQIRWYFLRYLRIYKHIYIYILVTNQRSKKGKIANRKINKLILLEGIVYDEIKGIYIDIWPKTQCYYTGTKTHSILMYREVEAAFFMLQSLFNFMEAYKTRVGCRFVEHVPKNGLLLDFY